MRTKNAATAADPPQAAPCSIDHEFDRVVTRAGGRPINQQLRRREMRNAFSRYDPQRPSERHRTEAMDEDVIAEEIDALDCFLMVNMRSIARRTTDPDSLLWPLVRTLAKLVDEHLDEKSEYEMRQLDYALLHLEIASGGKIRFARKGPRMRPQT
jgi:hypothetical protein